MPRIFGQGEDATPQSDDVYVTVDLGTDRTVALPALGGYTNWSGYSPENMQAAHRLMKRERIRYYASSTLASLAVYTGLFAVAALQMRVFAGDAKVAGLSIGHWAAVGLMVGVSAYPMAASIAACRQPFKDYGERKAPEFAGTVALSVLLSPLMTLIMAQPKACGYAVLHGLLANVNPLLVAVCLYGLEKGCKALRHCREKPLNIGVEPSSYAELQPWVEVEQAQSRSSNLYGL